MSLHLKPVRCRTLASLGGHLNRYPPRPAYSYCFQTTVRSYSKGTKSSTGFSKSATTATIDEVFSRTSGSGGESSTRPRPLSRLSTPDLYRTMMLSHIFISPALSRLCLGILGRLASSSIPIFDPDRNRILNHMLRLFIYNHFCAGTEAQEIKSAINRIKSTGVAGVILNYAREIVAHDLTEIDPTVDVSAQQIQSWLDGNLKTLSCLDEGDYLGIKYTGAGGAVTSTLIEGAEPPKQFSAALAKICEAAREQGTRVLVDAEQQIYQPTIDRWTVDLMRKYNAGLGDPIIFNTYQAYLKATRGVLRDHLELAQQGGWAVGIKLVRGAYILNEIRDRIHDTKADTDNDYNGIVHDLLFRDFDGMSGKDFPRISLFVCGHNDESIHRALAVHKKLPATTEQQSLEFGQLYGMADHVTGALLSEIEKSYGPADRLNRTWDEVKASGAPLVFKCINWGSVRECLHFLMRRAAENQGAAERLQDGFSEAWKELRQRWFGLRR